MSYPAAKMVVTAVASCIALVAGGQFDEALAQQSRQLPIRGVVRAINQAAIATDMQSRVTAIGFREAQSFKKGDVLIRFDCERLQAEHAAANAVHREMMLSLDSNVALDRKGAVGKIEVEVSRARVDKAAAEAAALGARVKQCVIAAPFDGRVTELNVNEHEFPAQGKPLISIVDSTRFEVDIVVPSLMLRELGPGAAFKFAVDETGKTYDVHLLRIGAAVDPVSQTVKLTAAFDSADPAILSGMSGTAFFASQESGQ